MIVCFILQMEAMHLGESINIDINIYIYIFFFFNTRLD